MPPEDKFLFKARHNLSLAYYGYVSNKQQEDWRYPTSTWHYKSKRMFQQSLWHYGESLYQAQEQVTDNVLSWVRSEVVMLPKHDAGILVSMRLLSMRLQQAKKEPSEIQIFKFAVCVRRRTCISKRKHEQ